MPPVCHGIRQPMTIRIACGAATRPQFSRDRQNRRSLFSVWERSQEKRRYYEALLPGRASPRIDAGCRASNRTSPTSRIVCLTDRRPRTQTVAARNDQPSRVTRPDPLTRLDLPRTDMLQCTCHPEPRPAEYRRCQDNSGVSRAVRGTRGTYFFLRRIAGVTPRARSAAASAASMA